MAYLGQAGYWVVMIKNLRIQYFFIGKVVKELLDIANSIQKKEIDIFLIFIDEGMKGEIVIVNGI